MLKKKNKDAPQQGVANILDKLRADWETGNRNSAVFETYMDVLRPTRLPQAEAQSAADQLLLYPCLSIPSVVRLIFRLPLPSFESRTAFHFVMCSPWLQLMREFEVKVGLKLEMMVQRWTDTLPKLVQYMTRLELIDVPAEASERKFAFQILMTIHTVYCDRL